MNLSAELVVQSVWCLKMWIFKMFFQKLRTEFNREARETGREALLLAIAVPVGEERISSGYKIPEVDRLVVERLTRVYLYHKFWLSVELKLSRTRVHTCIYNRPYIFLTWISLCKKNRIKAKTIFVNELIILYLVEKHHLDFYSIMYKIGPMFPFQVTF